MVIYLLAIWLFMQPCLAHGYLLIGVMVIHTTIIFTNPSARAGYDTRSIFKRSLTGLNSEFSFSKTSCLTKAEEPSLPYYLPIAGWRIVGFIPFPRVLVLCEMESVSSRIWTRVAVSISYDDNHYTTGTSIIHTTIPYSFMNDIVGHSTMIGTWSFIYGWCNYSRHMVTEACVVGNSCSHI